MVPPPLLLPLLPRTLHLIFLQRVQLSPTPQINARVQVGWHLESKMPKKKKKEEKVCSSLLYGPWGD